jgi:tetratricopeptide (TPR) repeat protein
MKTVFIFFIYIFAFQFGFSQENKLDSIEKSLDYIQIDSVKLKALKTLTNAYSNRNKKKHYKYIKQGIDLAQKQNKKRYEGFFTNELGYFYRKNDQLDSSFYSYKKAQSIYLKIPDSSKYYYINYDIGNLKKQQGKYEDAINYFLKGIAFFEKNKHKNSVKNMLIGKFNIASLYTVMKDFDNAIIKFKDVLSNPNANNDKRLLGATYVNLIGIFSAVKQIDSALVYAKKAEKINTSNRALAHLTNNIGQLYEQKKDYKKSLNYYHKSLSYFTKIESNKGIIRSYNNIGNLYTTMSKFKLAEKNLLKANTLLKNTKNIYSLQHNYNMLTHLYENDRKYENAFKFQKLSIKLNDSILGIEKQKAISDLEIKYETEKTKREKDVAKAETLLAENKTKQTQNYFIGSIIIAALILMSSIFYIARIRTRKKAELVAVELNEAKKRIVLEKQYRDSELKALKAQMNPHFMFNAMNSIQSLILKGDKDDAYSYLSKFATLIRENLNMSEKNFIYFDEETRLLETYLQLEKLRFKTDFTYSITDTIEDDIKIPSMIIQPFVENAIKHGLLHKNGPKKLQIEFQQTDVLICTITDNGIGREVSSIINKRQKNKPASFSTSAITKRFDLLKEYYNLDLGFEYHDLKNETNNSGTKVIIKIPYVLDD